MAESEAVQTILNTISTASPAVTDKERLIETVRVGIIIAVYGDLMNREERAEILTIITKVFRMLEVCETNGPQEARKFGLGLLAEEAQWPR